MKHSIKGKNHIFSEEFKKIYLKNLTKFNLMTYNSGFKYFNYLANSHLNENSNLIEFSHTGSIMLKNKFSSKLRLKYRPKLLQNINYLIFRNKINVKEEYAKVSQKDKNFTYSDYIKKIYSQILLAKVGSKKILQPVLIKPISDKKNI